MVPEPRTVIVTCSLEEGSILQVSIELEARGFQVEEVLACAGCILGRWHQGLELLENIDGVIAVGLSEEVGAVGCDEHQPGEC